jgi:ribosomal protein S12 methylthiotransferase
MFGYSDEDGTEAAGLDGKLPEEEIARRVADLADLADELMAQRAAERVGELSDVLVEEALDTARYLGRTEYQAPEVDGTTELHCDRKLAPGDLISAVISGSDGVDLIATPPADRH